MSRKNKRSEKKNVCVSGRRHRTVNCFVRGRRGKELRNIPRGRESPKGVVVVKKNHGAICPPSFCSRRPFNFVDIYTRISRSFPRPRTRQAKLLSRTHRPESVGLELAFRSVRSAIDSSRVSSSPPELFYFEKIEKRKNRWKCFSSDGYLKRRGNSTKIHMFDFQLRSPYSLVISWSIEKKKKNFPLDLLRKKCGSHEDAPF